MRVLARDSRPDGGLRSLGAWLASTSWFMPGVLGGLVSQALLFAALGGLGMIRDRRSEKPPRPSR